MCKQHHKNALNPFLNGLKNGLKNATSKHFFTNGTSHEESEYELNMGNFSVICLNIDKI